MKRKYLFIMIAVFFAGAMLSCRPGDEDPEEGSLLGQILLLSSLNGTVWYGKPVWNTCVYEPGGLNGIASCLVFEKAYTEIYNGSDLMSSVLTLNGASVQGKIEVTLPGFDLVPFRCSFDVDGNTFYNPATEITSVNLSQRNSCIASGAGSASLLVYRADLYRDSQSGYMELEIVHAASSDRIKIGFVFEINKGM